MDKVDPTQPAPGAKPHWSKIYRVQLMMLGALLLVLLGVVFVLPNLVTPVEKAKVAEAVKPAKPTAKLESPWRDAQLAKERREAQDILSPMLEAQKQLEEKAVQRWAAEAYQKALDSASAADTLYRQREFNQAKIQYRNTLKQFQSLLSESEQVLSRSLRQGADAIIAGDAPQALAAFDLALSIDPKNNDALEGQARAQVLDQVLSLLNKGELLQKSGFLEEAQGKYKEAQALDPASPPIEVRLANIKQAILERDFTEAMSAGYSALNAGAFNKAQTAFKRALALKPGAGEVSTALAQTRNQKTQSDIKALLGSAAQHEQQEAWQHAADAFEKALALDGSLVQARIGKIRTQARADFDSQLVKLLEEPGRLATEAVYREAQRLYADAKALKDPGPRLQQQRNDLAKQLQLAVTPVTVRLQSDNITDITLYKVGHLGQFDIREMTLKPGHYTAVGTRSGYRDVRREFTVSAEGPSPAQAIVIQCIEPVSGEG